MEVDYSNRKYKSIPWVQSALVIKRKSVWIYKGRLCVSGDTGPIAQTALVSSPTANRSGVKLIFLLTAQTRWPIRDVDAYQAFLQSGNLNPAGRVILHPHAMAKLPRNPELRHPNVDLETTKSPHRGFFLLRPLYGSRGDPTRWFSELSEVRRDDGSRQLQSDACFFS